MHPWAPRFDWGHLQNWVPGALGAFAAILLVVVAANSPTQTNSKPADAPPPQSAALPNKTQTDTAPAPSEPAAPQHSSVTDNAAKAAVTPAASLITTGEAAKPGPMHDHAMVKAQAEPAAPVQDPSKPNKESQKAATSPQGDAVAGRQVFKK